MDKILVTGAGGMLGRKLLTILSKDYEVIPTYSGQLTHSDFPILDVTNNDEVSRVLNQICPKVVVHTAAATDVDKCETDRDWSWRVNAIGTRNVAEASRKNGFKLIYISTDYVFDGTKGLYQEENETNPINYYGFTKLQGENFVKKFCDDFIIARPCCLFDWNPKKLNFATWVIDSLNTKKEITVVEDHYDSPSFTDDLSKILLMLIRNDAHGIYHTAGAERVNRYEFAMKIAKTFKLDTTLIKPIQMRDLKPWIAKRPRDSSLQNNKIRKIGISPSDLNKALEKMKFIQERNQSNDAFH